ncbi:TPA: type II restriction endonuclease subunit R [Escherichia coli]|uniref:Type II restriction endonuclease subunit R n=2 Tax=Escherichia coli TaxID=562 RepID=A0AAQ2I717_ECOLX|nr:type II restriction endonuclease subunit R [Escherichia coli]EMC9018295.1 restriction endonuclease subunit S [Shigella sonnei]HDQ6845555.1 restriction endonuclease subunit S [Escherichia coli O174:H8]EEQ8941977.1 type II restriction endonuclease subunit R [Escherichia coli]EER4743838.1 type II restriction endonuclease subunit R [Escherichia coli]
MGDLFYVSTGSLISSGRLKPGKIKRVSAKSDQNGIIGEFDTEFMDDARHYENFISVNFFGDAFYHPYCASVEMKVHVLTLKSSKSDFNAKRGLYVASMINKALKGRFNYGQQLSSSKLRDGEYFISLPVKNNEIDWFFMDNYIEELEAAHIEELEAAHIEELEAYLIAAGLSDYQLTEKDYLILEHFKNIEFSGFPVTELFSVCNTGNILSRDIIENSGDVPYLCASRDNNSVSSYIAYDDSLLEKGNCIFIGGKTFVVTYQERDFFSNDSHNLRLYVNNEDGRTKFAYLGIISCIYRSISHKYSWGDSVSNRKIKNDVIWLPVKNKSPDFCYINDLISVVHKLVIKDVVQYAERKMNAYRQAITSRGYDDSGVS